MRSSLTIVALLAACSAAPTPAPARVPAFPGAEGAGAMSLGGRGGRAIHVTNLNDSGLGSLREAIDAEGPRTIVFDVGGTIRLSKPLTIRNGRVTIAGQTAPGGGISLRQYGLRVDADNVVIRFMRSRVGDQGRAHDDAFSVVGGNRIILDHVSASWGTDETLSVSPNWKRGNGPDWVTVQWSIISESVCGPKNAKIHHCYGSLAGDSHGGRMTWHHNLWAHHGGRMPRPGNNFPPSQDSKGSLLEFRSNVFYNWGSIQAGYDSGPPSVIKSNFVDNSYWTGPNSKGSLMYENRNPFAHAWFSGNRVNGELLADQSSKVLSRTPGFLASRPFDVAPVAPDPAQSAYARVLASAGDSLVRDPVDARVVASVRARSGRLIVNQDEVGGWPELARGTPWRDSDRDGLPDEWETKHRLNPSDPRDGAADRDRDGYTNLEEWLNALAAPAMAR